MSRSKRIAVVFPQPILASVPSFLSMTTLLIEEGYKIDVFTCFSEEYDKVFFNSNKVRLLSLDFPENFKVPKPVVPQTFWRKLIRRAGRLFLHILSGLSGWLRIWKIWPSKKKYTAVIVFDPEGCKALYTNGWQIAGRPAFAIGPIFYYSLELLLSKELKHWRDKDLRFYNSLLLRSAMRIIVQDQERADIIASDYNVPVSRFILVPNSPIKQKPTKKTQYWHKRFNLKSDTKIALHAGNIDEWTGLDEVGKYVNLWPDNWVLVIHTRYNIDKAKPNLRNRFALLLNDLKGEKVFFSTTPLDSDSFDKAVYDSDVCIAYYIPGNSRFTGSNLKNIGLSSGKVAYALRAGVPIIASSQTNLGEFVEREMCGVTVFSPEDVGKALEKIEMDYAGFRKNALKAFEMHFDFKSGFAEVINQLENL